jgi:hypothetical protein
MYDQLGIFQGYDSAVNSLNLKADDIVILCHDDIQILQNRSDFHEILQSALDKPLTGFVGVAGTTELGTNAMWWDPNRRAQGKHSGFVFQGQDYYSMTPNYFGPHRNCVVLDGLFLAAKYSTIQLIGGLAKPAQFPNGWDYYDLYYTLTAYEKGLENRTIPLIMTHYSDGMMRPTWDQNRKEFLKMFRLPVSCK